MIYYYTTLPNKLALCVALRPSVHLSVCPSDRSVCCLCMGFSLNNESSQNVPICCTVTCRAVLMPRSQGSIHHTSQSSDTQCVVIDKRMVIQSSKLMVSCRVTVRVFSTIFFIFSCEIIQTGGHLNNNLKSFSHFHL